MKKKEIFVYDWCLKDNIFVQQKCHRRQIALFAIAIATIQIIICTLVLSIINTGILFAGPGISLVHALDCGSYPTFPFVTIT